MSSNNTPTFDIFSLTKPEVDVLVETIDHQVQRLQDSKVEMIKDKSTLTSSDELLAAMASVDEDIKLLNGVRFKLERRST